MLFKIRRADLRRALRQLQANRGSNSKDVRVTILVSEYAATFRALGTDSECPVNGISPGVVHLPITVLSRICDMVPLKEPELRFTDGAVACGKTSIRHSAIVVGGIPHIGFQVPIDPSTFELVVIGRVLGDELIAEQGLERRLKTATEEMNEAISNAASHLGPFGVADVALRGLVEAAIEEARENIRRGLMFTH